MAIRSFQTRLDRPSPRPVFLTSPRRLDVFFYTSNVDKFLQARLVFERFGLVLNQFRGRSEPYSEDYSIGTHGLLARAIREIVATVGRSNLFFVEDTSMRLEALSTPDNDVPGLSVKEWFQKTSFGELDAQLRSLSDDRRATVKSDIALHIPGARHPVYFHAATDGYVASTPPDFPESPQYPWLTPKTFNGWFVPEGADRPLGGMSFEESWLYDFRIKAMVQLIDRLEEYAAVLNLPVQAYSRSRRRTTDARQPRLLKTGRVFVVVGRTCAGKTTFADRAVASVDARFVEASSIVRMIRSECSDPEPDPFIYAQKLMQERGYDVVANEVLRIYGTESERDVVISGFRTVQELETLRQHRPDAKVVLIEANDRIRFQRHLNRARPGAPIKFSAFRELDKQQETFGLLRVVEDFADVKLVNEGSLEEFFQKVDFVLGGRSSSNLAGVTIDVRPRQKRDKSQLYRCLVALSESGRPLDCDEIEEATRRYGSMVRYNNANKILKRVPELARRIEIAGQRVHYEIQEAGRAYVRFMDDSEGPALASRHRRRSP